MRRPNEEMGKFRKRRYCGKECAARQRAQATGPVSPYRVPYRERNVNHWADMRYAMLLRPCEVCQLEEATTTICRAGQPANYCRRCYEEYQTMLACGDLPRSLIGCSLNRWASIEETESM